MIWIGLLGALLVLGGWQFWLVRRLGSAPRWGDVLDERGARWVRRGASVLVLGGLVLLIVAEVLQRSVAPEPWRIVLWLGLTWVAMLWYLTVTLLVVALVCAVLRIVGRRTWRDRVARWGAVGALVLATATTAYGLVEASQVRTTEREVALADLGEGLDGLRVAFVSDLHVGPVRDADFVRDIVERVNAARPDLVVLGGDYHDGPDRFVGAYLDPLAGLEAPYGVVAVSGNHEFLNGDADATLERLERLGITVLRNEAVEITRDGARLVVAGVHDRQGTGENAPDPDAALSATEPSDAILYVVHEPAELAPGRGIDLQLSGHTHGGQLWPFGLLVRLDQPTVSGLSDVDGVPILTSRGAGAWGPPVRVAAPPEVVVVTLRAG